MKLFKKVSAAILAGVMALSMMVGCASTVTPGTGTPDALPDAPATPDAGSAAEIMSIMNAHNQLRGLSTISNDAVLADKAAKLIDAILASNMTSTTPSTPNLPNTADDVNVSGTNGEIEIIGSKVVSTFNSGVTTVIPAVNRVFYTDGTVVQGRNPFVMTAPVASANWDDVIVPINRFVYQADNTTKLGLEQFAETAVTNNWKVGVATKKVGIYTVALIVTETSISVG